MIGATTNHRLRAALAPWVVALSALLGAELPPAVAQAPSQPAATALRVAEWKAIKSTIGGQLAALKAGDAAKAFAHATPGIRRQFGTPENFLAMVRNAYGALLAARYTEFLEGAVVEGTVIQPLRLIAPDNTVVVALYTMEKQADGRWRIAGCVLATSTVQAA